MWKFALLPSQKPISLTDSTFYCYGVDAGTGLFIDASAAKLFDAKGQSVWEEVFINKAEKNGYKGFVYDFNGHNLATFSTGYGDGCYATYIGLDEKGKVCRLITDFALVNWQKLRLK